MVNPDWMWDLYKEVCFKLEDIKLVYIKQPSPNYSQHSINVEMNDSKIFTIDRRDNKDLAQKYVEVFIDSLKEKQNG